MTVNLDFITSLPRDLGNGKISCIKTSYYECIYNAALNISKKHGCRTPWTSNLELPICSNETESLMESYKAYENAMTNKNGQCSEMCESLETSLFTINNGMRKDGKALLGIHLPRRVMFTEEHYLYSSVSLFAEIGGYVGLLLGYSFLNLAYIFDNFMAKEIQNLETKS